MTTQKSPEKKEHPITWEQIGDFFFWLLFIVTVCLALWKIGDFLLPVPHHPFADGHQLECDMQGKLMNHREPTAYWDIRYVGINCIDTDNVWHHFDFSSSTNPS